MGFEPTVTEVVAYEATELTAAQTRLNLCALSGLLPYSGEG